MLQQCLAEDVFIRLNKIKKTFNAEWKRYPESIKKKILLDLSVSFTYNTNAIEGSTITLDETEELLKKKISPNKPLKDVTETLNHSKAFFKIINNQNPLTLKFLLQCHNDIFSQTKLDIAGIIREYSVKVGDYRAPDWQDLDILLKEFSVLF